jgi:hypothetical protein
VREALIMAEFHRDVAESFMTGRSLKQEEIQRAQVHALLAINDTLQLILQELQPTIEYRGPVGKNPTMHRTTTFAVDDEDLPDPSEEDMPT